jgi:hypothetical protein
LARFSTGAAYRQVLVEVLARDYGLNHEVILYTAATLPMNEHRVQRLRLGALAQADVDPHATLVIPPSTALEPNPQVRARVGALDLASSASCAGES